MSQFSYYLPADAIANLFSVLSWGTMIIYNVLLFKFELSRSIWLWKHIVVKPNEELLQQHNTTVVLRGARMRCNVSWVELSHPSLKLCTTIQQPNPLHHSDTSLTQEVATVASSNTLTFTDLEITYITVKSSFVLCHIHWQVKGLL